MNTDTRYQAAQAMLDQAELLFTAEECRAALAAWVSWQDAPPRIPL